MHESLKIQRQEPASYKTISIRLPVNLLQQLDSLAEQAERSRNNLIKQMLTRAVEHTSIEE